MNKIFSSVLLFTVLLFLPISVFSLNTFDYITTGCSPGPHSCHVQCNDVGTVYHECTVTTCTFSPSGLGDCNGTCNEVLAYDADTICKFSCGNACAFDCSKCRKNGLNPKDWHCDNCK